MKAYLLLAAALALLPAAALAQTGNGGSDAGPTQPQATTPSSATAPRHAMRQGAGEQKSLTPQRFVRQAAEGGMFEVQSSQIALQKTQNDQIKAFAQRMIDDHGKANDALKQLAAGNQLRVPPRLTKRNQSRLDQLQGLSGTAFDTAYLRAQRIAHRQAIRLFQRYADTGTNADLKKWAQATLPTLQEHQKMLQDIKKPS